MGEEKKRVLFLCTGNSCRSHMAEAFLRNLGGGAYESLSAGSRPANYVHPLAVEAMRERGQDLSAHRSKDIKEFLPPGGDPPDVVVSVCDDAARDCPTFPLKVKRLHWPFDDPALAEGTEAEKMSVFRRVRNEIEARIRRALDVGEL